MAREKKKSLSKLRRHLKFKKGIYIGVFSVLALLITALWAAQTLMNKDQEHVKTVAAISGTPEMKYQQALKEAEEGNLDEARLIMRRLARLGDKPDNPLGYGKAHLWVAKDQLQNFDPNFLWKFPTGGDVKKKTLPGKPDDIATVQRHLQHAISLNPELGEASLLQAAIYSAQGNRNQAVSVLLDSVSNEESPHPEFHVPLANLLHMRGEDLALEELAWHLFSTLGQAVRLGRGVEVPVRVRYVVSALMLKKDGNAEATIRRMEAQYSVKRKLRTESSDSEAVSAREQVKALRMGFHYHRALQLLKSAGGGGSDKYEQVVDELEKALSVKPSCETAVDGLTWISNKAPSLRSRIRTIMKASISDDETSNSQAKSNTSLAFALAMDRDDPSRKEYLQRAVAKEPNNSRALIALAEQLLGEKEPDYDKLAELAANALKYSSPEGHIKCRKILGLASLKQKKFQEAVVNLEKALSGDQDRAMIHGWLAEAYSALNQKALAASHRARSSK